MSSPLALLPLPRSARLPLPSSSARGCACGRGRRGRGSGRPDEGIQKLILFLFDNKCESEVYTTAIVRCCTKKIRPEICVSNNIFHFSVHSVFGGGGEGVKWNNISTGGESRGRKPKLTAATIRSWKRSF